MRLGMPLQCIARTALAVAVLGCSIGRSTREAPPSAVADTVITDVVGHYMDEQAEELGRIDASVIERIGDEIRIQWDSAVVFDYDSAMLKIAFQRNLDELAAVLTRYDDTDIVISGHMDGSGPESYNQRLSERRAISLRGYLTDRGIVPSRITAVGYGRHSSGPGDGDGLTNSIMEIRIRPKEELKARAAEG